MSLNPKIMLLPAGPYVEIDGGSLFLGRDCILALRIPALSNKVVSNRHLRIWLHGGHWLLEDLGSTNGTWLRGERMLQRTALLAGDEFSLGRNGPKFQWEPPDRNPAAGATIDEDIPSMVDTLHDNADGSDERPYRVGQTPEIVLLHIGSQREYRAQGYTIVLGRDPGAAQILIRSDEEKHVSGRHAEVQFRSNGTCVIRDLGSRNGTWVNGLQLAGEQVVHVGDRIVLGLPASTLEVKKILC